MNKEQKLIEKYEELYQQAMVRMLDKSDFDPEAWLDDEEIKEFRKGFEAVHGYKYWE